jgi:hypothetical protein
MLKRLGLYLSQPVREYVNKKSQSSILLKAISEYLRQAKRPEVCFLYYGNRKLSVDRRVKRYNRPQDLTRHFRREHLDRLNKDERVECGFCGEAGAQDAHAESRAYHTQDPFLTTSPTKFLARFCTEGRLRCTFGVQNCRTCNE